MIKSTFKISKMDCPSEEQLIRMRLEGIESVKQLNFDIPNRRLEVFHEEGVGVFENSIYELGLDAVLQGSEEFMDELASKHSEVLQKRVLWSVLLINFSFFIVEIMYGWWSKSMGLVADSLDMFADAVVYGLSLMAVGAIMSRKKRVAKLSGYFQIVLAVLGLIEVIRRFVNPEKMPHFMTMIVVSALALMANSVCLWLIQKSKSEEAHMKASAIFTSNDIIINAGVILAGLLVYLTSSNYPDLIIGAIIFIIVSKGAFRILKLAH